MRRVQFTGVGIVVAVLGLAMVAAPRVVAQVSPASLKGVVFDQTNRLLPGATVTLTSTSDPPRTMERTTSETGLFAFPDLAPGMYRLEASAVGFRTVRAEVQVSGPAEQNLRLHVGSLRETVNVRRARSRRPAPSSPRRDVGDGVRAIRDRRCEAGIGRVGGLIVPPQKVRHVNPEYPEPFYSQRLGGEVRFVGQIGVDGAVTSLVVQGAAHDVLVAAAAQAVQQWRFLPVMLNCEAIPVEINVTVVFDPS